MKIIHCADIHLESPLGTHYTRDMANIRNNEMLTAFRYMLDYAVSESVEAVIIAGDMFDRERISEKTADFVYNVIASHSDVDVYYLCGNHDRDGFISRFEKLPDNLKIFSYDKKIYSYKTPFRTITILGKETAQELPRLDESHFNIVVMHGQIGEDINLRKYENCGIDYVALGHIHSYRKEKLDVRGVWCYSGSLCGRGFDECGEHGFVVLDIDERTGKCETTFEKADNRMIHEISIDISTLMTTTQIIEKIDIVLSDKGCAEEDFVRVILCGNVDYTCEKDIDIIEKTFERRFFVFLIKDKTRYRIDYGSFANDRSLKGEFVKLVNEQDMTEEDKAAVIRYGIRAILGEEIY